MKKIYILILLAGFLYSCEEALEDLNPFASEFSATVSGTVSSTFSGEANFVHTKLASNDPQTSGLAIELENSVNSSESILLGVQVNNTADGVAVGTYDVDIDNQVIIVSFFYSNDVAGYFIPDPTKTNQIILTSIEGTRVKGSFTFNVASSINYTDVVEVSGTFDAVGVTTTQ